MNLHEWARRHAQAADGPSAVARLRAGESDEQVARATGLPPATVAGVRSYYDLMEPGSHVCDGTACHFAGGAALAAELGLRGPTSGVRCLGHCYAAPAFLSGDRVFAKPAAQPLASWVEGWGEGPEPHEDLAPLPRRSLADPPIVLRNLLPGGRRAGLGEYELPPGPDILAAIADAGLRGRGGAAFPTAAKWDSARGTDAPERFVVANGDEGDPGSFVDRLLLEEDPHAVLAGMLACARVVGAARGFVYVRGEYPRAQSAVREAIREARATGRLGVHFDVEVVSGAGAYVCGEETALLRSIEGLRGESQPKPPYPTQAGLFGRPTVVQNVETLAVVPWIARTRRRGGTKAVSLSGAIAHPGVVEIPLGTPLRHVLTDAGGGPPAGRRWGMALVGGPMGRVIPEARFDVALAYDLLPGLGHAGIVLLDESVTPRALAEHLFAFAAAESCGACAPCRLGTARLRAMPDRPRMERLLETLEMGSLCGFGQAVPRPIRDLLEHFGDEVFAC
jgi:NADH:ubiquinone oxidoreductase subunit F (NADH-binding)